jgi:hypothetical protein
MIVDFILLAWFIISSTVGAWVIGSKIGTSLADLVIRRRCG